MVLIPVIESEVPTIFRAVRTPETLSCCEVRLVVDVTPNVVIPVIESDVPTILASVVIPVTRSCCEVRLVVDVIPNVEIPLIESEVPTILANVVIPVTFKEVTEAIPPITFVAIPALLMLLMNYLQKL